MLNQSTYVTMFTCVGCGNRGTTGFFLFPEDAYKRKTWLENCGVDPSIPIPVRARLCSKHFERDDITCVNHRFKLKKNAVPSIKVDPDKTRLAHQYKKCCRVCGVVYAESFHDVPKDTKIREAWLRNLGITFGDFNPIPTATWSLCCSHFSADDIIWHPHSLNRRLKRGAMPLDISQNARNNQTGQSTSSSKTNCSKEFSENSEVISISRKLIENKGSDQSTSSWEKKSVTPTTTDLTSKDVGDSSIFERELEKNNKRIRRLKEKNARLKKELTSHLDLLMDHQDLLTDFIAKIKKNNKRIRQLKEEKNQWEKESMGLRTLLDDLLLEELVKKKGKEMIKIFRQPLENPVQ